MAASQARLFTARQAIDAGMTYPQVRRRRERGCWVAVAGDALALSTLRPDPWVRAQAAAVTWPDAVVCLASAAGVHRLPVPQCENVQVIVPNRRASRGRLITHQLPLEQRDVTRFGLAWVTTRSRTIFDCLGRLPDAESEALMSWVITRELMPRDDLERAVAARRRWWG
ncbi:MAG: hypothetical protein ABIR34_09650, partial [Marmoricola sp.]